MTENILNISAATDKMNVVNTIPTQKKILQHSGFTFARLLHFH